LILFLIRLANAKMPPNLMLCHPDTVFVILKVYCGFYKGHKQRMRISYGALVFWMVLHANEPSVRWNFNNFDQTCVRVETGGFHSCIFHLFFIDIIKFISMTMTL